MAEPDPLRAAWKRLRREHRLANAAPETEAQAEAVRAQLREAVRATTRACAAERARLKALATPPDLGDAALAQMARFCARLPLADFEGLLHLVPRLVNVVTLAEGIPVAGTGVKLPLDLQKIASSCSNAFYAPRKFAAVQMAFSAPRCRILIFHTGRIVGTGALMHF